MAALTEPTVLVANAGSSSVKLSLLGTGEHPIAKKDLGAIGEGSGSELTSAVAELIAERTPDAVAHRIVHGGTTYCSAVIVDDEVRTTLDTLVDLAPLHQPKSLQLLDELRTRLPHLPHVACFDTAFHATLPPAASTYAVPAEWRDRWGVRRFGFHGLSHAYASARAAELMGDAPHRRIVSCHLGAGASLAAVVDGRSVDTTMGFTPLDGLVMATRSGSLDPGLVLWLEEHEKLRPHDVADALEQRSGLTGLAGTGDMREVVQRADSGDDAARLALDVYVFSVVRNVGAMAASAQGLDVLVFTGGVGEHAARVRELVTDRLAYLGVRIAGEANNAVDGDTDITAAVAQARTAVVAAREDLQMAREARALLA